MNFGYDQYPSELLVKPASFEFYIIKDGEYTFNGDFDFISIDNNPYKQKNKTMHLQKGMHSVIFEPEVANPTVSIGDLTYSLEMLSSKNFTSDAYDYMEIKTEPVAKQLSKYSEWIGCEKKCGYDSKIRFREVIPELYSVNDKMPDGSLIETQDCNKMCNDDLAIFTEWKKRTGCPMNTFPKSTQDKFFKSETGENIESSLYIDKLKYSENLDELYTWKGTANSVFATECHGNLFSEGSSLYRGGRIYSKDFIGYLEYNDNGMFSFNSIDSVPYIIRKASMTPGNVCTFSNGALVFKENETIVETVSLNAAKIVVNAYCCFLMTSTDHVVQIIGDTPTYLDLSDFNSYYFKPSSKEYEILKIETLTLTLSNRLSYRSSGIEIWGLDIPAGGFLSFSKNGIKIFNAILVEVMSYSVKNVSKYSISKEAIEMLNDKGRLISIYGNSPSMLTSGVEIALPSSDSEAIKIKSSNSHLIYQPDGNLVLYSEDGPTWNSGTQNRPSTHFYISQTGEVFIMNEKEIVFRTNFSVNSEFAAIIIIGNWCLICTQIAGKLEINRVFPNSTNMNAMKKVTKKYAELIRNKFPAYTIKYKSHKGDVQGFPESIPNITNYLNFTKCGAGDIWCDQPKTVSNNNYTVTLPLAVTAVNYLTGEPVIGSINSNIYNFSNKPILGYEPLYNEKYIGSFSFPNIIINANPGTVLIKKEVDDFTNDFSESGMYVVSLIGDNKLTSIVMKDILSTGDDLPLSSNFSLMKDVKSGFDNPLDDILAARREMLEEACYGNSFSKDKCEELSYLSPLFYKGYVTEGFENFKSQEWLLFIILLIACVSLCFLYKWKNNKHKANARQNQK